MKKRNMLYTVAVILLVVLLAAAFSGCAESGAERLTKRWAKAYEQKDAETLAACFFPKSSDDYKSSLQVASELLANIDFDVEIYSVTLTAKQDAYAALEIDMWMKAGGTDENGEYVTREGRGVVTAEMFKYDARWYFESALDPVSQLGLADE